MTICVSGIMRKKFFKTETDQIPLKVYNVSGKVGSLSVLSIENDFAKDIDFEEVINSFASVKARKRTF